MRFRKVIKRIVPQPIRFVLKRTKLYVYMLGRKKRTLRKELFDQQRELGIDNIPVFIVSYNQLTYLKNIIANLEKHNIRNIIIIDNASTYEPLLKYYDEISYQVIHMDHNYGHMVFWTNSLFDEYRKNFYIVTDPDLEIIDECPDDCLQVMFNLLEKFPSIRKVGLSLKLDDLPESGQFYKEVIDWETQFYKNKLLFTNVYLATVDTTFALYMPDSINICKDFGFGMRTVCPYQAKHLPWYKTKDEVSEEDQNYSKSKLASTGWWDVASGNVMREN